MIYRGEHKNIKMITWTINQQCNFKCFYCGIWPWQNNKEVQTPVDVNILSESLSFLGKDWLINISGGEPFLEKNIIDICKEVTKRHYLSLITNLSTPNIYDFADEIRPEKCLFINTAVHITEREKNDEKLRSFIDKIIYLQKKGFNVTCFYVSHPLLFNRVKSDIEFLKSNGIKKTSIRIFYGEYDKKHYPAFFTSDEKEFLQSIEADFPEHEVLNRSHNYRGQLCGAGQKNFVMNRKGELRRCFSTLRNYGNLFEKTIKIDSKAKPCPKDYCVCTYEGIRNAIEEKGSLISTIEENIIESILCSRAHEKGIINKLYKCKISFINTLKKITIKFFIHKFWVIIGTLKKFIIKVLYKLRSCF